MSPHQHTLPLAPPDPTLREQAERWMAEHPRAMALFAAFAEQRRARGQRFGIGALTERVRWECSIDAEAPREDFKINNNYRAYIARRLLELDPRLADYLETRAVSS